VAPTVAALRLLDAHDAPAATRLIDATLGQTSYRERAREILEAAVRGDPEWQVVAVILASVDVMAAFGPVSGAEGVWRIGFLLFGEAAARADVARQVIVHIARVAHRAAARMLVAELPADEVMGASITALRANGFQQEARIPDFYREGVAQLFLRRELTSDPTL
jgi:hypothetical protein